MSQIINLSQIVILAAFLFTQICVPFGFPAPVPLCSRVMLTNPMGAYRFHYRCHKSCVIYHCSKLRLFNPETRPHKFEVKQ